MDDFYKMGAVSGGGTLRLQMPILDKTVTSDVTGDFSLPDYQPEIKRLLRVSATVQPPSHYVGGGFAEFSGTVDYCILYAGNDGRVYCFPTSADYAFRLPLEAGTAFDLSGGLLCYADCETEHTIGRVAGPRRISVKSRIGARIKAYGNYLQEYKCQGRLPAGCGQEKLLLESEIGVCGYGVGTPLTLSEEISPESLPEQEEWRIISGDAQVVIHEATCETGRVAARGEAVVKLMLQRESENSQPVCMYRKLPFGGDISVEGLMAGGEAAVTGTCSELGLSLEQGRILCDVRIILHAKTWHKQMLSYIADWYATGCESECLTTDMTHPVGIRCINGSVTQSESRTLEELGLTKDMRVIDIAGVVLQDRTLCERGRVIVTGKCRYSLILLMPDGDMVVKEIDMPMRYVADAPIEADTPVDCEAVLRVLSVKARGDGQRLSVDAEVGVSLALTGKRTIRPVCKASIGAPKEKSPGRMTLCFPSRSDTLWSVGKRYARPIEELAEINGLQDEKRADDRASLSEVHVMVV